MKHMEKCLRKHYESPEMVEALLVFSDVLTTSTSETTPPSYDEGDWDINE